MSKRRYNIGDHLYHVHFSGSGEYDDGVIEPAEVSLSTYIIRTIRRAPRTSKSCPQTVYAHPKEATRHTKKGLVFESWGSEFVKAWLEDRDPGSRFTRLHRSKSAAYRGALAKVRADQRKPRNGWRLTDKDFKIIVGRLKSGITRDMNRK